MVSVGNNNVEKRSINGMVMIIINIISKYNDLPSLIESQDGGVIRRINKTSKKLKYEF